MTESPRITWLLERQAKAGELRVGLLGTAVSDHPDLPALCPPE